MKMLKHVMMLALLCSMACGSALESPPASGPRTAEIDVEKAEQRADRSGEWRTRVEGFTMWVDSTLEPRASQGEVFWLLEGRVSKNLRAFRAYDGSGRWYAGHVSGPRTFQVVLSTEDVARVISGERIHFDFFAVGSQPVYYGAVRYAPRFTNWSGASELYVFRAVNPVIVGDAVRFRGRAATRDGYELDLVYTDDDAEPWVASEPDGKYRFDWSPTELLLAADPTDQLVHFRFSDRADRYLEKRASIELRLVQLGVTLDSPFQVWPAPVCKDEVRTCLAELDHTDTETCGWANEVQPCLGETIELPEGATPERFVTDLSDEIVRWYEEHERDASAFGARPLDEILADLDADDVHALDDIEEGEYFDVDPRQFEIFWTPDPVFPRSDRIWYGVYEQSGRKRAVYVVN